LRARFFKGERVVAVRQHTHGAIIIEAGKKRGRHAGDDLPAAKG